jgi:hypothetical protein
MRFTIEQRHLTDNAGKPVGDQAKAVSFQVFDAESAEEAVKLLVKRESAQLMGEIMKFPGFHAVATIRTSGGVYTLQVAPSSLSRVPA